MISQGPLEESWYGCCFGLSYRHTVRFRLTLGGGGTRTPDTRMMIHTQPPKTPGKTVFLSKVQQLAQKTV
jgi:hypothetical protein